ncbi:MAG TPA: vWA domain-containing protein [Kofleriaceae bacterium]|nr:vWA domain-containing protein [Kofleriaceae bacterium]
MSKMLLLVGVLAACGPSSKTLPGNNGGGVDSGNGGGLSIDAPACATSVVTAQKVALDLYIMLDQSSSMSESVTGGTKWSTVKGALTTFLNQPGLDGVSVGIQYFGLPDSTGFSDSCTAADYAHAEVEIAPLPGVASQITTSINGHSPTTLTPTSAALQGAVDHAKAWGMSHPGEVTAVILATDGLPSECDTSLTTIDGIAAAAYAATPKIPTSFIGVGSSLANLNGIAMAGGTNMAFLVDTGGNVNQQFLQAMNDIRHAALGCTYSIPTDPNGGMVDYGSVNIVYQPGNGGAPITIPNVGTKAMCPANGQGWYYDNPQAPTQIVLCDSSCSGVEVDTTGSVNITLGCSTVIL